MTSRGAEKDTGEQRRILMSRGDEEDNDEQRSREGYWRAEDTDEQIR